MAPGKVLMWWCTAAPFLVSIHIIGTAAVGVASVENPKHALDFEDAAAPSDIAAGVSEGDNAVAGLLPPQLQQESLQSLTAAVKTTRERINLARYQEAQAVAAATQSQADFVLRQRDSSLEALKARVSTARAAEALLRAENADLMKELAAQRTASIPVAETKSQLPSNMLRAHINPVSYTAAVPKTEAAVRASASGVPTSRASGAIAAAPAAAISKDHVLFHWLLLVGVLVLVPLAAYVFASSSATQAKMKTGSSNACQQARSQDSRPYLAGRFRSAPPATNAAIRAPVASMKPAFKAGLVDAFLVQPDGIVDDED